ncbi:sulfotransferase family 2 domain-containing protein [Erythrobacter sp. HI0063]|jgi:hypothetical protein|uniref:sulfotransferase family 2 domain-containing protein n=1 Tax=Erythrobacter sp. HI0063 TaxID=1822240 RepID=UPI000A689A67|nr:sulfotransferase family 2 domain-containing protein [Erythrobacter sp. HI0063]
MFFDHPNRVIFIHNPKTGGRSIAKLFDFDDSEPFRFAHISPVVIRKKFFQSDWNNFFSFCFVRNPWRRYVSLYNFQRSATYAAMMNNNFSSTIARHFLLNEWIEYNTLSPQKANWFGVDQKLWWSGVTKAFRFEEIDRAHSELAHKFNLSNFLPHENASPLSESPDVDRLSDRSKDIIAELDRETIDEFGYVPE